jgi:Uncharacterized lipoprotein
MRAFRVSIVSLIAALVIVPATGCRPPVTQLAVPLEYRPTSTLQLGQFGGPLAAAPPLGVTVSDDRTDKTAVGTNVEEKDHPVPVLAAQESPEQFVREAVSRGLSESGLTIAPDPSQARCTLRLSITRFWTEESSLYRGSVAANAALVTKSGKSLWNGAVSGTSKRFGRSLSPENYQETFSDAVVELVQNLLGDSRLRDALPCNTPQAARSSSRKR